MAKTQHSQRGLSLLFILALLVASCGRAATSDQGGGKLEGTITISGAFALYPMMVRWGEEFKKVYPDVKLDISAGGAGKGMSDALGGAVDIGMVSREIYPEEEQKGAFWVPVTRDAVFAAVNQKNPVLEDLRRKGVTQDTFIDIYITGKITTWGQVVGRPEVTNPIHVFTRSDACGAADAWAKYLGNKKQENLMGVGVYGDPGVLDAVIKDPLGIGYNNLNYAYDAETGQAVAGAAIVPIDADSNGQADSVETYATKKEAMDAVATGKYPSPPARDLNLVTKGKPTGLTKTFIAWILTDGQSYVAEVGYIGLAKAKLGEALKKLD